MFDGFRLHQVDTGEASIRLRVGGSGPPLLLLHGGPQTHVMWHRVAPRLAEHFTVVTPDLRGHGGSSAPPTTADHEPYSKRAMARDQVAVMRQFGFDSFGVAGHDGGGRCAYRLTLDHPDRVTRLAVLDLVPTYEHYRRIGHASAQRYWHWFFLSQPFPIPETMIAGDPGFYFFRREWADLEHRPPFLAEEALADYLAAAGRPETVHAICEDHRAAATVDLRADEADLGARRIGCPVLVLWARRGLLPVLCDPIAVWSQWAYDVRGRAIDSGRHLAEEAPLETGRALLDFFLGD